MYITEQSNVTSNQPCGVLPQLNYYIHLWKERKAWRNKSTFFVLFLPNRLALCSLYPKCYGELRLQTLGVFKDEYLPGKNTWRKHSFAALHLYHNVCSFLANFKHPHLPLHTVSFVIHYLFQSWRMEISSWVGDSHLSGAHWWYLHDVPQTQVAQALSSSQSVLGSSHSAFILSPLRGSLFIQYSQKGHRPPIRSGGGFSTTQVYVAVLGTVVTRGDRSSSSKEARDRKLGRESGADTEHCTYGLSFTKHAQAVSTFNKYVRMVEWLNFLVWAPQVTQKERPIDCCHSDHSSWAQINRNGGSKCCISKWVLAELDQPAITAWIICDQHLRDSGVEESPVAQCPPQPAELPHLPAQLLWEATQAAGAPQGTPPTLEGHTTSKKPWGPPQSPPDSHHYNLGPDASARPSHHSHSGEQTQRLQSHSFHANSWLIKHPRWEHHLHLLPRERLPLTQSQMSFSLTFCVSK